MARGPDILTRAAPPLSATTDQPLATAERPPLSASNSAADQARGVAGEMSPEAQAAAAAARRGTGDAPGAAPADPAASAGAGDQAAGGAAAGQDEGAGAGEGVGKTGGDDKTGTGEEAGQAAGGEGQAQGQGESAGEGEGTAKPGDADPNINPETGKAWPDGTPDFVKREVSKSRNKARAAEAALQIERDRVTALEAQVAALQPKPPEPTPAQPPAFETPRPLRDAFENADAYESAIETWAAARAEHNTKWQLEHDARTANETAERERNQAAATAEMTLIADAHNKRREAAMEQFPDYVEVAEAESVNISPPMAHAIMVDDLGPQMAYYLGKNPDEATRIASIRNPGVQLVEMGKLAARLAVRPRTARSQTPAPIEPLRGGSNGADDRSNEPSMEAYGETRLAKLRSGRQPFVANTRARTN